MSSVTVSPVSSLRATSERMDRLAAQVVRRSSDSLIDLIQGLTSVLAPAVRVTKRPAAGFQLFSRAKDACCNIPEVDCPPRCVCEISWLASRGEQLNCTIRVRNASQASRSFDVEATEFQGPGGSAPVSVSPTSLELKPGARGLVDVSFTVPDELADGDYDAEVVITGGYDQCVELRLHVVPSQKCPPGRPHCFCEVVQGDPPVRIRAHHWYDHFQCTEPCSTTARVPGHD